MRRMQNAKQNNKNTAVKDGVCFELRRLEEDLMVSCQDLMDPDHPSHQHTSHHQLAC